MTRVLAVHTGGIGDFLLSCPALKRLAEKGPIELAGRPERLRLAVAAGMAQVAHDLDAIDFSSVFSTPSERLRRFLRSFERAVVWMRDDDRRIRQGLQSCGVAEVQTFPGLPPEDWTRHASEYYLECLGYPPDSEPFRLTISAMSAYDVVIHPGSGGRRKNWPLGRFKALAEALEVGGHDVTWCAGPAEEGLPIPAGRRLEAGSLFDLAEHLAGARLYIGNDSGITHLAAAAGAPTVVIFGPTDPRVWAPRGDHVRIVRGSPWPEVAEVLAAARPD